LSLGDIGLVAWLNLQVAR